jgi:hypothetical protein
VRGDRRLYVLQSAVAIAAIVLFVVYLAGGL